MVAPGSSLIGREEGGAGGGDDSGSGIDDRTVLIMISASAITFLDKRSITRAVYYQMTFAIL